MFDSSPARPLAPSTVDLYVYLLRRHILPRFAKTQVGRIAESSEVQKAMSGQLLLAVQRIGQSTERTAQQIDAQNQETETLLSSARRLVESVGVFKLPQTA